MTAQMKTRIGGYSHLQQSASKSWNTTE